MTDTYNLQRFIDAQEAIYEEVLNQLKLGIKSGHWIWYIFPQVRGLGRSGTAQEFAISSLKEAEAYLENSILGRRLSQCTQLVLNIESLTYRANFRLS
ncbi:MAG: DUF1810 family protein [Cyanobacteria bacterium P01_G01_bin.67]